MDDAAHPEILQKEPHLLSAAINCPRCSTTITRTIFLSSRLPTVHPPQYLRKDEPTNTLLSYAGITDGASYDDYVRVSFGGLRRCRMPVIPTISGTLVLTPRKPSQTYCPRSFSGNFIEVIRSAVRQSGYEPGQIRWLLTNQIKKTRVLDILHALGLNEDNDQVHDEELWQRRHWGHALLARIAGFRGTPDRPGDVVVLASSGIGFSWGAQVIESSG